MDVMQIPIPIPRWLLRASDTFRDWVNVPVWQRGRHKLRRIDIMVANGFVASVGVLMYGDNIASAAA